MQTKLTLRLDDLLIEQAKTYAQTIREISFAARRRVLFSPSYLVASKN